MVDRRRAWGEDRVYYEDEGGEYRKIPAIWTTALGPDPYVLVSEGRSYFRVDHLLELCRLAHNLSQTKTREVSSK